MWLAESAVHFWSTVGHAIDQVFAGYSHDAFCSSDHRVNLGSHDSGRSIIDRHDGRSDRATDATLTDE
jgi:hypothetical protein